MQPTNLTDPTYFHKVVDCQYACPAHTPVPEYIRLIGQGRYTDAYMGETLDAFKSGQAAMAMKETPSTQRITSGPTVVMTQAPTAPARAWLSSVATRMPQMMGQGLRNRAASTSDSSWVLSPISARATMPVERRKASKTVLQGPEKTRRPHSSPGPSGGCAVKGLARLEAVGAMAMGAKCVDADLCVVQSGYSPMTGEARV